MARFEYIAEDEGEASVMKGEILDIVGENEFGWWLGQKDSGELGWVPSNFFKQLSLEEYEEIVKRIVIERQKVEAKLKERQAELEKERQEQADRLRREAEERERANDPREIEKRRIQREIDEQNELIRLSNLKEEAEQRKLEKELKTIRIVEKADSIDESHSTESESDNEPMLPIIHPVEQEPSAQMYSAASAYSQSVHIFNCIVCKRPIDGFKVDILGGHAHVACHRCKTCGLPLGDIASFEHEDSIYCLEHYQEALSEKCNGCGQSVGNRFVKALGFAWHRECFVCEACARPFMGGQFHRHEGKAYCRDDFANLFATKCSTCSKPITSGITVKVLGRAFHEDCFRCPFNNHIIDPGAPLKVINGAVFCKEHASMPAENDLCARCNRQVKAGGYTVGDKKYHKSCFRCFKCSKIIRNGNFKTIEDEAYGIDCCL